MKWKLNWRKYCLLSAGDNENDSDVATDNITFTIKDIKLYLSMVILSAKNNQNLWNTPSKWFES